MAKIGIFFGVGTYGIFNEFPHPVPGILESEENLPLPKVLASLALHFDA